MSSAMPTAAACLAKHRRAALVVADALLRDHRETRFGPGFVFDNAVAVAVLETDALEQLRARAPRRADSAAHSARTRAGCPA